MPCHTFQVHTQIAPLITLSHSDQSFLCSNPNIQIYQDRRGDDAFRPIWMLAVIFIVLAAVWALGWKLYALSLRRNAADDFDSNSSFSVRLSWFTNFTANPDGPRTR